MTVRLIKILGLVFVLVVAVAAGSYTIIYLYRWEWMRAIVAGVFLLAGEIALVAWLVISRLERLERRIVDDQAQRRAALAVERSRPAHEPAFAWLSEGEHVGVFVPVLLGAGLILSALAYVVQRIAEATARATAEPALAADLARLAPPADGLAPKQTDTARPRVRLDDFGPVRSSSVGRRVRLLGVVTLALGLGFMAVDRIADATQSRPQTAEGVDSVILFDVTARNGSAIAAAEALWDLCSTDTRINAELVSATAIDDERVVIVVRPGLGDRAWRRLEGCVEDMTMLDMTAAADRLWPQGGQRG